MKTGLDARLIVGNNTLAFIGCQQCYGQKSGNHIQAIDDDDKWMDTIQNDRQAIHKNDDFGEESTKQGNGVLHVTIDKRCHKNHRLADRQILRHELKKVKQSKQHATDLDEHSFRGQSKEKNENRYDKVRKSQQLDFGTIIPNVQLHVSQGDFHSQRSDIVLSVHLLNNHLRLGVLQQTSTSTGFFRTTGRLWRTGILQERSFPSMEKRVILGCCYGGV